MTTQIGSLSERDLDFLLAEECISSRSFRAGLLEAVGLVEAADSTPFVRRGVTHSSGESDLELETVVASGERMVLLIENKVDAAMQKRQAERYAERARAYEAAGRCSIARTLLVAPEKYFGEDESETGFDGALSYENVSDLFRTSVTESARRSYKLAIIEAAIQKASLGYQPVADDEMGKLWDRYRAILDKLAPGLNMPPTGQRPSGSHFVYFKPDNFPAPVQLVHKFAYGNVDVQFPRWGAEIGRFRELIGDVVPAGSEIVRARASVVIRRRVPRVLLSDSHTEQESCIKEGVLAASDLLQWVRDSGDLLESVREGPKGEYAMFAPYFRRTREIDLGLKVLPGSTQLVVGDDSGLFLRSTAPGASSWEVEILQPGMPAERATRVEEGTRLHEYRKVAPNETCWDVGMTFGETPGTVLRVRTPEGVETTVRYPGDMRDA